MSWRKKNMNDKFSKKELLFIAKMISIFSGYSIKEISRMSQEEIDSYVKTFKRAGSFEFN
jgi:hypothetical protein